MLLAGDDDSQPQIGVSRSKKCIFDFSLNVFNHHERAMLKMMKIPTLQKKHFENKKGQGQQHTRTSSAFFTLNTEKGSPYHELLRI